MLFRRRRKPDPVPAQVIDPVIDAQIHWLQSRGLVLKDNVMTEEWIAVAADPTDPMSLAEARVDGSLCVEPSPVVSLEGDNLEQLVHDMADGLELPIDEADVDSSGSLNVRAANAHLSTDTVGRDHLEILTEVASEFVDSAHVLLAQARTLAIVHRDVAEQAETALREAENGSEQL